MDQPYFSRILKDDGTDIETAFRRDGHVHLGYYTDTATNDSSVQTYAAAADALTQHVFSAAAITDGMRVLDIGCGLGGSLAMLNEERSGVDLVGLNIDRLPLTVAYERVKARPTNRISFIEGDGSDLPFADASFDAIISIECVEHLSSRRQFFREARRVLRPGGRLCLTDYILRPHALPFVTIIAPVVSPMLQRLYGSFNPWPCPPLGYRLLGHLAGLRQVHNQDLTRNVLPSFRALRNVLVDHDASRALGTVHWLSRSRMITYRLLAFV